MTYLIQKEAAALERQKPLALLKKRNGAAALALAPWTEMERYSRSKEKEERRLERALQVAVLRPPLDIWFIGTFIK